MPQRSKYGRETKSNKVVNDARQRERKDERETRNGVFADRGCRQGCRLSCQKEATLCSGYTLSIPLLSKSEGEPQSAACVGATVANALSNGDPFEPDECACRFARGIRFFCDVRHAATVRSIHTTRSTSMQLALCRLAK